MIKHTVTLINRLGLHARAANKLLDTTCRFQSHIQMEFNGKQADGKSIMSVMLLAAPVGSEIHLTIEGEDENEMLEAVVTLINNRFDEED